MRGIVTLLCFEPNAQVGPIVLVPHIRLTLSGPVGVENESALLQHRRQIAVSVRPDLPGFKPSFARIDRAVLV